MKKEEILFSLLRMEVCGKPVNEEVKTTYTEEMLKEVYGLASRHDLAHIAGDALSKLDCLGANEVAGQFKLASRQAVYRYIRTDSEYQKLCQTLEDGEIPFLPLKGAVLRAYYPEPWMRTSCDIDILVQVEMLEAAVNLLVEKLGYVRKEQTDHDISMYAPGGLHVELHYMAVDEGRFPAAQAVLETIWSDAAPKAEGSCHYCMSDEMFYFYHVTHMAKHIENGGCGIRPFLDLWILNHRVTHDRQKRMELLARGGVLAFAQAAEKLSEVWFSGEEEDALSSQLAGFVLNGGVYGSLEGAVAVQQTKAGGKLKYALSKIFLPYSTIKHYYPILKKHKWLMPVYQVVRWFKLLFKGGMKRSMRELKTSAAYSVEESAATAELLKQLGL